MVAGLFYDRFIFTEKRHPLNSRKAKGFLSLLVLRKNSVSLKEYEFKIRGEMHSKCLPRGGWGGGSKDNVGEVANKE